MTVNWRISHKELVHEHVTHPATPRSRRRAEEQRLVKIPAIVPAAMTIHCLEKTMVTLWVFAKNQLVGLLCMGCEYMWTAAPSSSLFNSCNYS